MTPAQDRNRRHPAARRIRASCAPSAAGRSPRSRRTAGSRSGRSRRSISNPTRRCCTRCRRCCSSRRAAPAQIPDELAAYNPLIPQGSELVATVMFEIDDPVRRARVLATLGGVEDKAFMRVGGDMIRGVPEDDQERTREDGKASSVQFMRFPFTPAADRRLPRRRRRRRRGLRPSQLRPHGGDAAGRPPGAGARLRLTSQRPRAPGGL